LVPAAERVEFERRARRSLPGFAITVREAQGRMALAPDANEYVPVLYVEPLAGNEAAVGFDLASDSNRIQALETARAKGEVVATGRIRLVQETGDQYGLLLLAPMYRRGSDTTTAEARRGNLVGFASTVLRAGDLVASSVALLEPAGIDIAVLDEAAPSGEQLLHVAWSARRDDRPRDFESSWASSSSALEHRTSFSFAGRSWAVVVRPAPGFYQAGMRRAWLILATGLLFSTASAILIFLLRRRASELAQSNRALSREVQERKAAEQRLRLFQSLIHSSAEAIYFVDAETGRFRYANERAIRESGYSLAELSGLTVGQVVADSPLGESGDAWTEWVTSLESQPAAVIEGRQRCKNGETFPVELSASLATVGSRRFVVGIAEDISERKRAEVQQVELQERLLALSFLDGLTGIANRRRFDEYLATEWRRAARQGTSLGLILIDLDHFKLYNDRYGHLLGDECLRKVAGVLESAVSRPADLVARFGGEEMAMLLPETSQEGASRMAEKIRLRVERLELPHQDSPVSPVVTISVGVGWSTPKPGDSLDRFLNAVDAALYRAKREGRNRTGVSAQ
jgi:diguanylate cyclase (GGDEF)-like protein/PAS domain S-box-containing protein